MDTAAPATKPEIALSVVDSSAGRPPSIPSNGRPGETLLGSIEAAVHGSVSRFNTKHRQQDG